MQLHFPFSGVGNPADDQPSRDYQTAGTAATPRDDAPRIEFVRMRRARRYILRVRPDGTFRVTVPRGGSRREAEAFLFRHRRWAEKERRRVTAEHGPRVWQHGCSIPLRGVRECVSTERTGGVIVVTYGGRRIEVTPDVEDLRPSIEWDLRTLARAELVPRLHELAARQGLTVSRVTIRNQMSRWGSCSRGGSIALNFRLVQMPPDVCDYVLIHELMHLKQQNHSRRYWRLVEAVCPDYLAAEGWLRAEGKALF